MAHGKKNQNDRRNQLRAVGNGASVEISRNEYKNIARRAFHLRDHRSSLYTTRRRATVSFGTMFLFHHSEVCSEDVACVEISYPTLACISDSCSLFRRARRGGRNTIGLRLQWWTAQWVSREQSSRRRSGHPSQSGVISPSGGRAT